MRKIWIAYVLAGIWAWVGVAVANLNNNVWYPEMYQNDPLATLTGQVIAITAPFMIIFSYRQYKKRKARQQKSNVT